MKALIFALLFAPIFAQADVSVPRSKQYIYALYDIGGGASGASVVHGLGVSVPAGAVITDAWVYINTQFAASGTESLAVGCLGTSNVMGYNTVKNLAANNLFQGHLGATAASTASLIIGGATPATAFDANAVASVPAACEVAVTVRGDAGYTPYTAGKATVILEYFRQ